MQQHYNNTYKKKTTLKNNIMMTDEAKQARNEYMKEYKSKMSEAARAAANEYMREYRRRNPDKLRQYNENYWERKAMKLRGETIESKVIELKKQGLSLREIGLKLNISHMKASRILQDCNNL